MIKFHKIASFPYGRYNRAFDVRKVFFSDETSQFFLTGYIKSDINGFVIAIHRELNYLEDLTVIDFNDDKKNIIIKENGTFDIELSNSTVKGLLKKINASITINEVSNYSDYNNKCLTQIEQLNKEFPVEYVYIMMRYKKDVFLNAYNPEMIKDFCDKILLELYSNSNDFQKIILKNNNYILDLFQYIFFKKAYYSLNIKNLYKFLKIRDVILNNKLTLDSFDDAAYAFELDYNEQLMVGLFNNLSKRKTQTVTITPNKSSDEIKESFSKTLIQFLKIVKVIVKKNNYLLGEINIKPMYQIDILKMASSIKSLRFKDKDNYNKYVDIVFRDLIDFCYNDENKRVELEKSVDSNFNVFISDKNNYELTFIGA